tara:strand:- start:331 stop:492 length:162 start_codon:yes stop_codon:yes gene_type:complete
MKNIKIKQSIKKKIKKNNKKTLRKKGGSVFNKKKHIGGVKKYSIKFIPASSLF